MAADAVAVAKPTVVNIHTTTIAGAMTTTTTIATKTILKATSNKMQITN